MGFLGDFKDIVRLLNEVLGMFRQLSVQGRQKDKDGGGVLPSSEKRRIAAGVQAFFERNYDLRYNVMKQTEEFRRKAPPGDPEALIGQPEPLIDGPDGWQQLTDREFNRIVVEQMAQEGAGWAVDVELYVRSALVPAYSPVADYLKHCEPWDGQTDHIRRMAMRVPTDYKWWPDRFHRWFLAMVAQWMNLSRDFGNAIVPMLIGGQGTHKSTFCRLLLPPELREYYIDDIKLDSAEQVERMLGRMLLVNIDEYNAKTVREQARIKRVLTEKDVQTRRMRSDQYVMLPRMASFIATTNEREPLTDPTGSRRYVCCEVTGIIDTDTPIDYQLLYGQAVSELQAGAPWHFTKDEELLIAQHNEMYRVQTTPEEILLTWFEPAVREKKYFMPAISILEELRRHLRPGDVPSMKLLTTALKAASFPYGAQGGQRGWYARRRDGQGQ